MARLKTCFIVPSLNFTSAGIVAASSTSSWSSSGTRDSRPCAMLTRSSTCSSAGSSVLKSKWVILSKYDSWPTLRPLKMPWKVSNGEYVAERVEVDLAGRGAARG